MIFIQHGPSWKPKTDEILKMNLAKGIIWDPREETIERIEEKKIHLVVMEIMMQKAWQNQILPNLRVQE